MYKIFKKKSAKKGNTKNGIKGYWLVSSHRLTPITSKVTSFQILTEYVSFRKERDELQKSIANLKVRFFSATELKVTLYYSFPGFKGSSVKPLAMQEIVSCFITLNFLSYGFCKCVLLLAYLF